MLTRVGALLLLLLLVVGTRLLSAATASSNPSAEVTMALGLVLVVSYLAGRLAARFGIPSITGYMVMGLLLGPNALSLFAPEFGLLSRQTIAGLRLLDGAALGLIALTAGGELRLSIIRRRGRSILLIIGCHLLIVISGVSLVSFFIRSSITGLSQLPLLSAVAAALLLGVSAVAKSPATTIAIIEEYHPHGPMTEVVLAVTVAKDVVVVTVFTVMLALALRLLQTTGETQQLGQAMFELAWEVLGSLLLGLIVGWLFKLYGRRVGTEMPLVVLAIAFLSGALSQGLQLSGLLVCMVAGFYVENFSTQGAKLIEAVERHSLPLYIVFFTIAGASLDLSALRQTWVLALALVVSRLVFTAVATYVGGRWAGEPRAVQFHAWTGFVGQAGVTLGFAGLIAQRVPGVGELLATMIVAGVAINQLAGPILFRLGLGLAGEIHKPDPESRAEAPSRPLQQIRSWTMYD